MKKCVKCLGHCSWRSILVAIFPIDIARLNRLTWNIVERSNSFGQATLNESVPSIGHRWHRLVNATWRYFANKAQLCNKVKHETVIGTTGWLPRVSPYNALGYAVSQLQRCRCQCPHSPYHRRRPMLSRLRSVGRPPEFTHYTVCILKVTSTVEWKEGLLSAEYRLFASGN